MPIQISKNMAKRWQTLFDRANEKYNITDHVPFLQLFIIKINQPQPTDLESLYGKAIEEIEKYATEETPEPLRSFARVMTGCLLILDDSKAKPPKTNLEAGIKYLRKTDLRQTGGLSLESSPRLELPLDGQNWLRIAQYVDFKQTPQDDWSHYIRERTFTAAVNTIYIHTYKDAIKDKKFKQEENLTQAIHLMEQYAEEKIPSENKKYSAQRLLLEFYAVQEDHTQLQKVRHYLAKLQPIHLQQLPTSFWRRTLIHLYDKNRSTFGLNKEDSTEFVTKYHTYIANTLIHQLDSVVSMAKFDRAIHKQNDSLDKLQSQRPQDTAAIAQAEAELEKKMQERRAEHFPSPEDFSKELYLITQTGIEPLTSIAAYIYVVYLAHYPEGDASRTFGGGLISQQNTKYWYDHIKMEKLEQRLIHPTHFGIAQVAEQLEMITLHRELFVSILNNLDDPTAETPEAKDAWIKIGKYIHKLPEGTIKQIFQRYGTHIMASLEENARGKMTAETKEALENAVKYGTSLQQTLAHLLLGAHDIHTADATSDSNVQKGITHLVDGGIPFAQTQGYLTDDDYYKMMVRNRIPEAFDNDVKKCQKFISKFMPKFYMIALAKYEASRDKRFNDPDKQDVLAALKLIKDYGKGDSLEKAIASYIFISEHAKGETQYRNIKDVYAPIVGHTLLEDYITNISVSPDIRAELAKLGVKLTPKTLLDLLKKLPEHVFKNENVRRFLLNEIECNLSEAIDQSEIKKHSASFGDLMDRKISIISEKKELHELTLQLYDQFTELCPDSTERNQALYRQAALAAHTLTIDAAIVHFTKITPSLDPVITFSHAHMPTLSPTQLRQILARSAATNQWNCWSVIHSNRSLAKNVNFKILISAIEASQEVSMIQWETIPANIRVLWYQYGSSQTRDLILQNLLLNDVFKKLNEEDKKILGETILQYSDMRDASEYQAFMKILQSALSIEYMFDLLISENTSSKVKNEITQHLISQEEDKLFAELEKYSRPSSLDRVASAISEFILPERFDKQKQYLLITARLVYNDRSVSRWMRHCEKFGFSPIPAFMLLSTQEQIDFTKHWYPKDITRLFEIFMQNITVETLQTIDRLLQTRDIIRKLSSDTVIQLFEVLLKEPSADAIKIIQNCIDKLSAAQKPLVFSALLKNQVFIERALAAKDIKFIERLTTNYIQLTDAEKSWEDTSAIYANFRPHKALQQHLLKQIFASPKHVASMRSMLGQAEKHPAKAHLDNWPVYRFLPKLIRTLNDTALDAWKELFGAETALPLADLLQRPWVRDCLSPEAQDKLNAIEERLHTAKQTGLWEKFEITLNRILTHFKYYFNTGKEKKLHTALAQRTTVSEAAATKDSTTFSMLVSDLLARGDLPEHRKTVALMANYIEELKVYKRQIQIMKEVPSETLKKLHDLLNAIELAQPDCNTTDHTFYTGRLIAAFEKLETEFDEINKILQNPKNKEKEEIKEKKARQLGDLRRQHAAIIAKSYTRVNKTPEEFRLLLAQESLFKAPQQTLLNEARTMREAAQEVVAASMPAPDTTTQRPRSLLSFFRRLRPS